MQNWETITAFIECFYLHLFTHHNIIYQILFSFYNFVCALLNDANCTNWHCFTLAINIFLFFFSSNLVNLIKTDTNTIERWSTLKVTNAVVFFYLFLFSVLHLISQSFLKRKKQFIRDKIQTSKYILFINTSNEKSQNIRLTMWWFSFRIWSTIYTFFVFFYFYLFSTRCFTLVSLLIFVFFSFIPFWLMNVTLCFTEFKRTLKEEQKKKKFCT